jgi:hypothetical protein
MPVIAAARMQKMTAIEMMVRALARLFLSAT